MFRLFLLIIALQISVSAQNLEPAKSFGKLKSAVSFDINDAGFIYVTDSQTNEVYKYSAKGELLKSIGGYGWQKEAFDNPIDVFATTLNIYVCDYNNHRVQIFDKDLNFLYEFTKRNSDDAMSFGYPMCSGVSSQGDIFVLDGDNQRIIKYDLRGNYILEIGNNDAGQYALNNPTDFAIAGSSRLFITDGNIIKVFDIFGNAMTTIDPGIEKPHVSIDGNILTISGKSTIKFMTLLPSSPKLQTFTPVDFDDEIKDAIVNENSVYILTSYGIYKFKR